MYTHRKFPYTYFRIPAFLEFNNPCLNFITKFAKFMYSCHGQSKPFACKCGQWMCSKPRRRQQNLNGVNPDG